LARFFDTGDRHGINTQHTARRRVLLTSLNGAETPANMSLPGYRLHQLKGERKVQ
jgi:proteic killer suppression protein